MSLKRTLAEYTQTKYCIGLNSGTSALQMALLASDIGPGDEVITTPHSWISTTWAISYVGATPVFVDINSDSFTLDSKLVQSAITEKTKAILPVDLYGQLCDWQSLEEIAEENNLVLIEDGAQAHGARKDGRPAGCYGHAACFSFYPGKNLGAFGEGGAVTTNDHEIAARITRLRDHAQDGRHNHVEVGYNARMEGIQGATLNVKLKYLDAWNQRRREIASQYQDKLSGLAELSLPEHPHNAESHVWHLYSVQLKNRNREEFRKRLEQDGVSSGIHYPKPIPYQPAYESLGYHPGDFSVAENVMSHSVSLPIFPEMTDQQVKEVIKSVRKALSTSDMPSHLRKVA